MDTQMTEGHYTQEMADGIAKYCGELLELLRMPQWTVLLMVDPCDDDAHAVIDPVEGRYVAQLYLNKDWMDSTDDKRLNTITHEMLHLIHARVNNSVWDATHYMRTDEFTPYWLRYKLETEYMVDHLAFFLAGTHNLQRSWDICFGRITEDEE